ncbi:hypothetical protein Pan44_54970 [Caulifigura coniformis]|uniref:Uncharacterized protein n=1 Tax=Caulifigura coniformis TaxID=2527983 RepID=A0A517SMT1_9PLAN|nr:hypothetical protein [Caulifigura coniformis]QDT57428.1 hypothetical protein Pan44_54970 [Caulifigura coniformis]
MNSSPGGPSPGWQPVLLPELPGAIVWALWQSPAALVFQVDPRTHAAFPGRISLRRLLAAVGIDPRTVAFWLAYGAVFDSGQGANPLFDQPLVPAPPHVDPSIVVQFAGPAQAPSLPTPAAPTPMQVPLQPAAAGERPAGLVHASGNEAMYSAIEADWNAIRILEAQLVGLRKQLNSQLTKLTSLNRDLAPEERLAADNQDNRDWQDARRWLRDGASVLSRVVKAYDIGVTSSAGNRNQFEDLIDRVVTPRRPIEGLAAIQQQFESHRKTVQSLQTEMQSAMNGPGRDGEMKANSVLSRIRSKMRGAKGKK